MVNLKRLRGQLTVDYLVEGRFISILKKIQKDCPAFDIKPTARITNRIMEATGVKLTLERPHKDNPSFVWIKYFPNGVRSINSPEYDGLHYTTHSRLIFSVDIKKDTGNITRNELLAGVESTLKYWEALHRKTGSVLADLEAIVKEAEEEVSRFREFKRDCHPVIRDYIGDELK